MSAEFYARIGILRSARGTRMGRTTSIAGRDVPVKGNYLSSVYFSAGRRGKTEAGTWEFWSAVTDKHIVTVRCRKGSDPGKRFRKMEGKAKYQKAWRIASKANFIRPAELNAVIKWLNGHPDDKKFAAACKIGWP